MVESLKCIQCFKEMQLYCFQVWIAIPNNMENKEMNQFFLRFFFLSFILIEVLIYNIVLVSKLVNQSDSVIHVCMPAKSTHMHIFFQIIFPFRLLKQIFKTWNE